MTDGMMLGMLITGILIGYVFGVVMVWEYIERHGIED